MNDAEMRTLFDDLDAPERSGRFVVERALRTPTRLGEWHVVLRATTDNLYYQLSIYFPIAPNAPMPLYGFTGIEPGQYVKGEGQREGEMTWGDVRRALDTMGAEDPTRGVLDVVRTPGGGYACLVYVGLREGTGTVPSPRWVFSPREFSTLIATA